MEKEKHKTGKEKSLEYSIKDGTAFSVMTGFGEQYLSPLAIELGATNTQIGLLASVPQFIGSVIQLCTSKAARHFRSRRTMITFFVFLQALTWIPLAIIPVLDSTQDITLLIVFVTLYYSFGQFVAPVWNSLIGDLVDANARGRFFGMRNKITGATAFISLVAAGSILSALPKNELLQGFSLIFIIALAARIISWHYLGKTGDPPARPGRIEEFSFIGYLSRLRKTNYGKFALYYGFMNFSVNVAAPFFAVYMLRDLRMSYIEYTLITAAAALTSFLAMTYWGNLADRFGNKRILGLCGISLTIVPLFWLFSSDVSYLIAAQIVSGFVWAGFNLSSSNFVYDNVRPQNRTRVFSYHNVLSGTSIFLGAMAGSLLALSINTPWVFHSNLQVLFLISGIMRAATSLYFLPMIREMRYVEPISQRDFFLKYNGTGPFIGLTYRTVTGLHHSFRRIRGKKNREGIY
jgi:MFS family permease